MEGQVDAYPSASFVVTSTPQAFEAVVGFLGLTAYLELENSAT